MSIKLVVLNLIRTLQLGQIIEQMIHWTKRSLTLKMVEQPRTPIETVVIFRLLVLRRTREEAIREVGHRVNLKTSRPMEMMPATYLSILIKQVSISPIPARRPRNKATRTPSFQTQEMRTVSRASTDTALSISLRMPTGVGMITG